MPSTQGTNASDHGSSAGGASIGSPGVFRGKVAVVTGAARGIGRAAAVAMARSGAHIVGIDICATVDPHSGVTPATRADLEETGRLVEAGGKSMDEFRPGSTWLECSAESRAGDRGQVRGHRHFICQCGNPGVQASAGDGGP